MAPAWTCDRRGYRTIWAYVAAAKTAASCGSISATDQWGGNGVFRTRASGVSCRTARRKGHQIEHFAGP